MYILIVGNSDKRFDTFDFDADFDPNEHDRKMKELFNDEYYAGGEEEDQKPEFPEIDEELDIEPTWDKYDPTTDKIDLDAASYNEPHCEDPDFNVCFSLYIVVLPYILHICLVSLYILLIALIIDGC